MSVETVRPAGAGHETLYVLLGSVLILALAATVVGLRQQSHEAQALDAHQVDARLDLNAAEQGIYADPQVAAEDIQARLDDGEAAPSVDELAAEGFPPRRRRRREQPRRAPLEPRRNRRASELPGRQRQARGGRLVPPAARPRRSLAEARRGRCRRAGRRQRPGRRRLAPGGQPLRRRRDPSAPPLIAHRLHRRRFPCCSPVAHPVRAASPPSSRAALLAALLLALLAPLAQAEDGKRLRICIPTTAT